MGGRMMLLAAVAVGEQFGSKQGSTQDLRDISDLLLEGRLHIDPSQKAQPIRMETESLYNDTIAEIGRKFLTKPQLPDKDIQPCLQKVRGRKCEGWEDCYKATKEDIIPLMPKPNADGFTYMAWTVTGGASYNEMIPENHAMVQSVGFTNVLYVALDVDAVKVACRNNLPIVYWKPPKLSYSKVADSKFGIAQILCELGVDFTFFEMDVWWRSSPFPIFSQSTVDIQLPGHMDNGGAMNIGIFHVKANNRTKTLFKNVLKVHHRLQASDNPKQWNDYLGRPQQVFDQKIFDICVTRENPRLQQAFPECFYQTDEIKQFYDDYCPRHECCNPFVKTENCNKICAKLNKDWKHSDWKDGDPGWCIQSFRSQCIWRQPGGCPVGAQVGTPLGAAYAKIMVAKELFWWHGANGYYDSPTAKYVALDGPVAMNNARDLGCGTRGMTYCYSRVVATLFAVATMTNRIVVLPKATNKHGRVMFPFEFVNIESLGATGVEWREGHFLQNPKTRVRGPAAWMRLQNSSLYVFDGQTTRYSFGHDAGAHAKKGAGAIPEEYLLRYLAGSANAKTIMAKSQLLMLNFDFKLDSPKLEWLVESIEKKLRWCARPADYIEKRHGENPFRTAITGAYYCK